MKLHLRVPGDTVQLGQDSAAARIDLAAQRERLALAFARGGLPEEAYTAEDGRLAGELDRLGAQDAVTAIPAIDWDWPPEHVNAVLRAIIERVDLGPDMRPVAVVPAVPEWWTE